MLKFTRIQVHISYRNYTHYLKLGYNAVINKDLDILTEHLPSSSHVRVDAICEICGKEHNLIYCKYIENKKRRGFYGCKSCSRQKAALTSIERYGVDNYSKTKEWRSRFEKTNLEKYGHKTNLLNPEYQELIKDKLIEKYGTVEHWTIRKKRKKFSMNGIVQDLINDTINFSEDFYNDEIVKMNYHRYRNECRKLSKRNYKNLINNWDGYDYYDGDYIKENTNLEFNDPNYPTIDHKNSIYWGFINGKEPSEIANLSNLCITKRWINSKKREIIEENFKF